MTLAVELRDVTKRYADLTAVDRLSVTVPTGCVHGILGRNGAGKTTTIRMLMGILRPDSGSIAVLGAPPARSRHRLGYLPEEKGLYRKMRLLDLVVYFGRLKGMARHAAFAEADRLLGVLGLSEYRLERCEALSKGMGQKVQIAATLVHDPELVVLDEPFSGLDPVNVELVRDTVLKLKQRGRTVILSTHTMEQAEQICDSLLLIDAGRVLLEGALATIRASTDRSIRIDYDGDGAVLRSLPGVERVNDAGKHAELTLAPGTDSQAILKRLADVLVIRRFDTLDASLHEIFLRTVGALSPRSEAEQVQGAVSPRSEAEQGALSVRSEAEQGAVSVRSEAEQGALSVRSEAEQGAVSVRSEAEQGALSVRSEAEQIKQGAVSVRSEAEPEGQPG